MEYEILNLDIKNKFIGKKILKYNTISSTQEKSISLLENLNNHLDLNGTVIVSEQQTKGKGRLQRTWVSSLGGLWFSIIITRPKIPVLDITLIHMLSALSVCETINLFINSNALIKWPNDITINSKKISGILIDTSIEKDQIDYIVIGIGINVNIDIEVIRHEIKRDKKENKIYENNTNLDNDITSIKDELNGVDFDKLKILRILLEKIEDYFLLIERQIVKEDKKKDEYFHNQNRRKIIEKYRTLCETIGKRICVYNNGKKGYCGLVRGLDEYGYLILEREGNNKDIVIDKIYFGDISIREI